jgi:hypothetical protein
VLLGALLAFAVVVLGVIAWAQFTGAAGAQRGVVVHNELSEAIDVTFAGRSERITADDEVTFVVERDQFPTTITWRNDAVSDQDEIVYEDLVDAGFRISIDHNGVYPTSEYRDPPR